MENLYIWIDNHDKLDSSIRKLHRIAGYFPEGKSDSDPVKDMLGWVLPHGMPLQLLTANIGLVPNQDASITLALRPVLGIGREWPFPPGRSLGLRGYWPRVTPSPVFMLQDVFEISDAPPKEFEKLLDVMVYHRAPSDRLARGDNVLTNSLAQALPPISLITQDRLAEWSDFLAWKRKLVQANSLGLRYTGRRLNADDSLVFDVVAENQEAFSACQKGIARDDVLALPLAASEDRWTYKIPATDRKGKQRKFEMGRVKGGAKMLAKAALLNHDWREEIRAEVSVELSPNDLDQLATSEMADDLRTELLEQIPEEGFLAVSRAGDLSLIRRHEQAVLKLQTQGGYAPYLAAYLFDVNYAQPSAKIPLLSGWINDRLNDSQKQAVQKMLAAQDLCMLQGPPGTGKTTVIAEAILQAVGRNETVLLASQAHTAVDNALGRLNLSPNVRAIRLGHGEKVTTEGKSFVQSGSLKRYYQSLKNHADQRYLTRWAEQDAAAASDTAWCEKADYALNDCREAQQKLDAHAQETGALTLLRDMAWRTLQDAAQQQADQDAVRNTLNALSASVRAAALGDAVIDTQTLPSSLHRPAEALLQQVARLADHGVDLKSNWMDWQHVRHQRSQTLNLALRDWLDLRLRLPLLGSDVARLQSARTNILQDPQTRLLMEALESEIEALSQRLDKGENVADQWRGKRAKLNACKKDTTNALDLAFYRRWFLDTELLLPPGATAPELAIRLAGRLAALEDTAASIQIAAGLLLGEIEQQLASAVGVTQADELPWKTADQTLKAHQALRDRLELQVLAVEGRAEQLLASSSEAVGSTRASSALSDETARVRTELLVRRDGRDEERALRSAWQPILAAWAADLAGVDAPARDWEVMGHEWPRLCNVVAITCNERDATLEDIGQTGFDLVIVDEVSKATPLELLLPLMRARRAVLVGDHRQLPPLFQEGTDAVTFADAVDAAEETGGANTALTSDNLKRFERMVTASLFKEHFEGANDSIRARLNVQFRMHPQIMTLVNHFYERQLSCGLKDPDRERAHPFTLLGVHDRPVLTPNDHVLWVDTSRDLRGKICSEDLDNNGRPMRTNRMEAELIAHMLAQLNAQASTKGYSPHQKLEVGIVSFYAGQLRAIKKALEGVTKNGQFDCLDVETNTVIRYQGKEKEVIFVSLVRNDGRDPASFNGIAPRRSSRANVARYEFINVALSRAKCLLVAMGARSMFETYEVKLPNMDGPGHKTRTVYRDIFDQLQREGHMCVARDVMPAPPKDKPPAPRRPGAWTEGRRR